MLRQPTANGLRTAALFAALSCLPACWLAVDIARLSAEGAVADASTGGDGSTIDRGDASSSRDAGRGGGDAGGGLEGGALDAQSACAATLTVSGLQMSDPSCYLNEDVTSQPASVVYPCDGGAVSFVFGTQTFTGTYSGGTLNVENVANYTDPYGCSYRSTQTISGSLASRSLAYSYDEVSTSPCDAGGACSANAQVNVN